MCSRQKLIPEERADFLLYSSHDRILQKLFEKTQELPFPEPGEKARQILPALSDSQNDEFYILSTLWSGENRHELELSTAREI